MECNLGVTNVTLSEIDACIVLRTNGKSVVYLATAENRPLTEDSPEFALAVMLKLFSNPKARQLGEMLVALDLNKVAAE